MVIIVALLSLMMVSAVFADAYESDEPANYKALGETLKSMKLIEGDGAGLNEKGTLTREQAVTILVRMNGWKSEAEAYAPKGVFTDVPANHWSAKYVEFAKEKGLTTGIGGGKFGLGLNVTAKEFASMLLRLLGHTADWATEDIMGKARTVSITNDAGEGKETMLRGQTFVYMVNTLLTSQKGSDAHFYVTLGIKSEYLDDAVKKIAAGEDNGGDVSKKPLQIDLSKYPRVIGTDTPTFDELRLTFNTVIAQPEKKNFKFTVSNSEGGEKAIDESKWTMAPGGDEIIFRFSDQNLHGKIVTCTINGIKSAGGFKMLGENVAVVQFKDFVTIQFVNVNVIDEKSFEGTLSIDVMPLAGKEHGCKVISDGVELKEGTDYKMSWGGRKFKAVFLRSEVYPKREAVLSIWGYVTSPYHKFMDEPVEVAADFTEFGNTEIPYVEPAEGESYIVYDIPDSSDIVDVVEAWNDSNEASVTENQQSTHGDSTDDILFNPTDLNGTPPLIFAHMLEGNYLRCYTTAPINDVGNPVYYGPNREVYAIESIKILSGREYNGFDIRFDKEVLNGGHLFVDNLFSTFGTETGPFDYYVYEEVVN